MKLLVQTKFELKLVAVFLVALTFVIVDKYLLMPWFMQIIILIPDNDGQSVGARDRRFAAVFHDDGHVVLFDLFSIKPVQTAHHTTSMTLRSST